MSSSTSSPWYAQGYQYYDQTPDETLDYQDEITIVQDEVTGGRDKTICLNMTLDTDMIQRIPVVETTKTEKAVSAPMDEKAELVLKDENALHFAVSILSTFPKRLSRSRSAPQLRDDDYLSFVQIQDHKLRDEIEVLDSLDRNMKLGSKLIEPVNEGPVLSNLIGSQNSTERPILRVQSSQENVDSTSEAHNLRSIADYIPAESLTRRALSSDGIGGVVTGAVGGAFGIAGTAAALAQCYMTRQSMRDKSQADIELDELRGRHTRIVEDIEDRYQKLQRYNDDLEARRTDLAAFDKDIQLRTSQNDAQRSDLIRREECLDRRARVLDERAADLLYGGEIRDGVASSSLNSFSLETLTGSFPGSQKWKLREMSEREWALNDRSRELRKRESSIMQQEEELERDREQFIDHRKNAQTLTSRLNFLNVMGELQLITKARRLENENKRIEEKINSAVAKRCELREQTMQHQLEKVEEQEKQLKAEAEDLRGQKKGNKEKTDEIAELYREALVLHTKLAARETRIKKQEIELNGRQGDLEERIALAKEKTKGLEKQGFEARHRNALRSIKLDKRQKQLEEREKELDEQEERSRELRRQIQLELAELEKKSR